MKDLVQSQIAPVSGVSSMTEHLPNDVFHTSSFMQGHNAECLELMHAVDDAWGAFFRQLGEALLAAIGLRRDGMRS